MPRRRTTHPSPPIVYSPQPIVQSPQSPTLVFHPRIPSPLPASPDGPQDSLFSTRASPITWHPNAIPPSPSPEAPDPRPVRHPKYYLDDGIIFQAEGTLFKVPRYMLTKNSAFSQSYQLPTPDDIISNENFDTHPIILHDVSATDFTHVLEILYPLTIYGYPTCVEKWTEVEWKPVFHLARQWQMSDLLDEASIRLRACASPFTKIFIGRSAELGDWLREGIVELCLRSQPLTDDEVGGLELSDILKIARARERLRSEVMKADQHSKWSHNYYGDCSVYVTNFPDAESYVKHRGVHAVLDQIFGLEPCDVNELSEC